MPNINFELNLNKHPKDVPNRALISARNVQLSNDLSCLQTELSLKAHILLNDLLQDRYLAGVIPCNKEFVLFIAPNNYKEEIDSNGSVLLDIVRCKEDQVNINDDIPIESYDDFLHNVCYNSFVWHGGKLKGTFTYNIKSQLIIAIAESDTITGDLIPLKTINLGVFGDSSSDNDNDLNLSDGQLSLNPEIKIPSITNFNYVNGLAYKGWYSFFIRYKINSVDYTKWYDVGFPIFIDELEKVQLFNYFIKGQGTGWTDEQHTTRIQRLFEYIGFGIKDYISSGSNTCNKTVELTIDNKGNQFKKYQIGIIQSNKDDERGFKTLDIDITETSFLLDFGSLETYEVNDLLFEKYNYYDVKNIINYKNRLYISNYKEVIDSKKDINDLASLFYIAIKRTEFNYKQANIISDLPTLYFFNASNVNQYCIINAGNIRGSFNIEINADGEYISGGGEHIDFNIGYGSGNVPGRWLIDNILIEYMNPMVDRPGSTSQDVDVTVDFDSSHTIRVYGRVWLNVNTSERIGGDDAHPEYRITGTLTSTINIELNGGVEVDSTPEDNYQHRLKNTTLLPGETYNFYIHFVNKYGESTDGIKINICPREDENHNIINYSVENDDGSLTIDGNPLDKYIQANKSCYIYYPEIIINNDVSKEELLNFFGDYTGFFLTYEKFQKTKQFCGIFSRYDFNYENNNMMEYPYNYEDEYQSPYENYLHYSGKPDDDGKYKFRFYSTNIDTLDVIELNFTKIRIEGKYFKSIDIIGTNDKNVANQNNSGGIDERDEILYATSKDYDILNAHYVSAHNFSKNNEYRGSYIEIELSNPDEFLNDVGIPKSTDPYEGDVSNFIFKAILLSDTKNLYLSENKTLIKFTNTFYFEDMNFNSEGIVEECNKSEIISIHLGLNGFCTFNTALIYNNNQVILNTGYNLFLLDTYYSYISSNLFKNDGQQTDSKIDSWTAIPMVCNITYIDYNNYPYESRRFKTLPEIISIRTEPISETVGQSVFEFRHATIIQPMNSIDLFENKIGSQDNNIKKTYINYTNTSISEFNKRIIRSNPIADESFENSWRIVSPEAYKDITENKGNITNLIALGTTFLVHTEHSLFMFDRDNTLQSGEGGAMQLAMPDIFDVDYKEVIGSYLGHGGLQDSEAYIINDFGYIYYDNDSSTIFRFKKKKANSTTPNLEDINGTISEFINKFKPYKIRFANDIDNNRIILSINYSNDLNKTIGEGIGTRRIYEKELNNITLSFNYKIDRWISIHDYTFDFAFNTKQKLYMCLNSKNDENTENNETNSFICCINTSNVSIRKLQMPAKITIKNGTNIKHDLYYGSFAKLINNEIIEEHKDSIISIMINDGYELIKTLEFITWKLYQIKHTDIANYSQFDDNEPRQEIKTPYSGNKLRIYNDCVDTGYIDISCINNKFNKSIMDYKKPWYEFGNWNFNYFRDIKNSKQLKAKDMSRLYGNYFIIELVFGNEDNERIEFETLNCKLINNKTI